ncbi:spore germination protein [Tuberibacillus sp. Marseille-P3662]|uniref:spore germination protein n=1 Tax=Tuberibacillus sp. Marseille-P3662 TaxID=1965358 RepID=UPI000A1CC543|nr:spore germination protein [Tuberibacillus sp. Marseille-P3662]
MANKQSNENKEKKTNTEHANKEENTSVKPNYKDNVDWLRSELGVSKSFDMLHLDLFYAGRDMSLFTIDGMTKDKITHFLMELLAGLEEEDLANHPLERLVRTYLPYIEVSTETSLDKVAFWVLSGASALVVDGLDKVIIIDARTYPVRGPKEPDVERVVRGPRDGFVETIVFNTALIRRRVRDPSLRMEYMSVARRSKTDICVCYIEDIVNPNIVETIKKNVSQIDTDGLPMGEKTIEEFIGGRHFNPYPTVRYTERPDTAAVHLYEGRVIVIVDGTPVALIAPSTYWNQLQHAEEFRHKPITGCYLRMIRYLCVWASIFMLPIWYLLASHPGFAGGAAFIEIDKQLDMPLVGQILLIEFGIDALRMATVHTPSAMGSALGLVSAIVIGQIAIQAGLFAKEVILYMSVAAIGTFATPMYEVSLANRLARVGLILLAVLFGLPGFIAGVLVFTIYLTSLKSFYMPYLWPFIPFDPSAMKDVLFRIPKPLNNRRPKALYPKDPDK